MSAENSNLYGYRHKLQPLYDPAFAQRKDVDTNAGLWLDKYIQNQDREDTTSRSKLIEKVVAFPLPAAYSHFYHRWEQALTEYGVTQQQKRLARTKGRMIIGLGDESVLETSIALHHTYGVPYIPGSALKGLAASYARQRLGEDWKKGKNTESAYNVVFGDIEEAGYITFFDALPYVPPNMQPECALYQDVITVHHPNYYQKKDKPPSDWESPTPIPFLSATGAYLIALAAPNLEHGELWVEKTFEILEHALKEMGIGAKTSSGYGRMSFAAMPKNGEAR